MTPEILRKLYLDDNLSIAKIATKLNSTPKTISNRLKKYHIPLRSKKQLIDLTGHNFGNLHVLKLSTTTTSNRAAKWLCQCACGNKTIVNASSLKNGATKSCGCIKKTATSKTNLEDLTNKKFQKLVVLHRAENNKNNQTQWRCRCDCGNELTVPAYYLKRTGYNQCKNCNLSYSQRHRKNKSHEDISWQYFKGLRDGAYARNLDFKISQEDIWNLYIRQNRKCALSGTDIEFVRYAFHRNGKFQTASVDRIDSSKGYTKDNIQIIHKHINKMKQDFNNAYFIEMCVKIAENTHA